MRLNRTLRSMMFLVHLGAVAALSGCGSPRDKVECTREDGLHPDCVCKLENTTDYPGWMPVETACAGFGSCCLRNHYGDVQCDCYQSNEPCNDGISVASCYDLPLYYACDSHGNCTLKSSAPDGGSNSGNQPDLAPVCQGQGLKQDCNSNYKQIGSGLFGSDCCPGLVCSNGAHPPLHDNPYEYACSSPTCNIYDGTCKSDTDCCGQLTCIGSLCQ